MGGLGVNTSSSRVLDPYGGQSARNAQRYQSQFGGPQSRAFGWGFDPESNFGQELSSRADAGNPFAQYLQTTQGILPQVQADAARAGQEIASRAPGAFQGYMAQAQDYLRNLLPMLQGQVGQGFGGLDQAGRTLTSAEGAANLPGAQYGVDQARQMLEQANSPIQSQALYQNALRQATQASQGAAAGRGLLDAGSQVGREEGLARDLASQYAQQQFGNQQAALGGYGDALGTQQAAGGLLGGLAGQRGALAGQRGQLAGLGAELGQSGITTSQGIMEALPYYAQLLQSGSQLPFQAAQQLQGFFAASQNPTLALLQATAPQIGQESKGWHA